jgi:hypothetical protein
LGPNAPVLTIKGLFFLDHVSTSQMLKPIEVYMYERATRRKYTKSGYISWENGQDTNLILV